MERVHDGIEVEGLDLTDPAEALEGGLEKRKNKGNKNSRI